MTCGEDHTARLWSLADGTLRTAPLVHPAPVVEATFSSDGTYVATLARDQHLRIWHAASGMLMSPPLPVASTLVKCFFTNRPARLMWVERAGQISADVLTPIEGAPRALHATVGIYTDYQMNPSGGPTRIPSEDRELFWNLVFKMGM